MIRKYRIRKHVSSYSSMNGRPCTYYTVEYNYLTIFGIEFWKRIEDFEPISDDYVFLSQSEAKDVITKFVNYKEQLEHNNEIVEIKGEQFFNKDDKFVNPYDHLLDGQWEAKYQCMIQNGVKILRKKDLKYVFSYINNTYGKDYYKRFKTK